MLADDCHVLVIGSGGSGIRAAIEAARYGNTILISKTLTGKGGCTTMAEGGYNAVMRADDACSLHAEDTLSGGAYLNDPELVEVLVREAPERMADLMEWGAVFDLSDEDEIAQRPFGGQRFPRTCYAGDRTGHEIVTTLVEHLRSTDVEVMTEVAVIDLLRSDDGAVVGAAGLDRKGELVTVRGDSTILATGGGTRMYDISTNSASCTGDGFACAYRAGAELIDMEMLQFHPTGAVYPYDARGRLVTEAVRGEGGVLLNSLGERFMSRYDPERMELSTRDVVARAIATEVLEGRGTLHSGVYLDVTHLAPGEVEARLPIMLEQFLHFGVDIREEPMEVAPTAHHMMGGLRITPFCQTTVPGLFACGEVTGGVHGANRLGGNALADTQVFGKRAGEAAGKANRSSAAVDDRQIDALHSRLDAFPEGTADPALLRRRLKRVMWTGAGIFRTAEGLTGALAEIREISAQHPRAAYQSNLIECCTLENMCLTASLVVRAALMRRESRGAHVRQDVDTTWAPGESPYGHSYLSLEREGIERVGAGV